MGNSNKVQPIDQKEILIDQNKSNESKIIEGGKRRKFLIDPFYTEEKYDNAKKISNWISTSEHKEFYMVFKSDNGKDIFLYRENIMNSTNPVRNSKLILFTQNNNRMIFHMSDRFNYIYDFCLHKINEIICYENRTMKKIIWNTKYDDSEIVLNNF